MIKIQFEHVLNQAIDAQLASSISLWVSTGSESLTFHKGLVAKNIKTDDNTLYDLASLTKILGTAPAIARAIALGKITLEEKPFRGWPEISVEHLLAHTSGLLAHVKFYESAGISDKDFFANQKIIFHELFKQQPVAKAGQKRLYSDLNFLALGFLLEERLKKPLHQIFLETVSYTHLDVYKRQASQIGYIKSQMLALKFGNNSLDIAPRILIATKKKLRIVADAH